MTLSNQGRRNRAPRVHVPNRESAVIGIGGKQISAVLSNLSINGGSLRLAKIFGENTFGEITLETTSGTIASPIQFLKSGADDVQAFRFVQLDSPTRARLENALAQMRKQGLGDRPRSVVEFCASAARRVVEKAKNRLEGA